MVVFVCTNFCARPYKFFPISYSSVIKTAETIAITLINADL